MCSLMHTYTRIQCSLMHTCVCVCLYARACVYMHTCSLLAHTLSHPHMRYTRARMYVCARTCMCVRMCACMYVCTLTIYSVWLSGTVCVCVFTQCIVRLLTHTPSPLGVIFFFRSFSGHCQTHYESDSQVFKNRCHFERRAESDESQSSQSHRIECDSNLMIDHQRDDSTLRSKHSLCLLCINDL